MKMRALKRRHDAHTLHERREWRRFCAAFAGSTLAGLSFGEWRAVRYWRA